MCNVCCRFWFDSPVFRSFRLPAHSPAPVSHSTRAVFFIVKSFKWKTPTPPQCVKKETVCYHHRHASFTPATTTISIVERSLTCSFVRDSLCTLLCCAVYGTFRMVHSNGDECSMLAFFYANTKLLLFCVASLPRLALGLIDIWQKQSFCPRSLYFNRKKWIFFCGIFSPN